VSFAAWLLRRYVLHATQQQQQQQPHMELELSSQTLNYAHALCARHDSQPTANQKRGQKPKAKSRAKNQATNLHIQIQISDFQTSSTCATTLHSFGGNLQQVQQQQQQQAEMPRRHEHWTRRHRHRHGDGVARRAGKTTQQGKRAKH